MAQTQINFQKISWQQLEKDSLTLFPKALDKIHEDDREIDTIVSISRGGDVIARMFSDFLDNMPISHITIQAYKGVKKEKETVISEVPSADFKNKTILLIDEVSDTGAALKVASDYLKTKSPKKIYTLTPYIKPYTKFKPDFWKISVDAWIIFPYEVKETATAFTNLFGTKEHAKEKLMEVGFEAWEVDAVL